MHVIELWRYDSLFWCALDIRVVFLVCRLSVTYQRGTEVKLAKSW